MSKEFVARAEEEIQNFVEGLGLRMELIGASNLSEALYFKISGYDKDFIEREKIFNDAIDAGDFDTPDLEGEEKYIHLRISTHNNVTTTSDWIDADFHVNICDEDDICIDDAIYQIEDYLKGF